MKKQNYVGGTYNPTDVLNGLRRRGIKFGNDPQTGAKTASAQHLPVVGIDTLGKLDYLMNYGKYTVYLPVVEPRFKMRIH